MARTESEIFVLNHIEKCGGVSFALHLIRQLEPDEIVLLFFPGKIDEFLKKYRQGHYEKPGRYFIYTHFASNVPELFPNRKVRMITLLREPWQRFLSAYKFSHDVSFFPKLPMDTFFAGSFHNFMTLTLGDGSLDLAKKRLETEYDFFGITEEFDNSMLMLARTFGFDGSGYVHMNRTSQAASPKHEEFRERFYELNQKDVELYNFARELFRSRWQEAEPKLSKPDKPAVADGTAYQETIATLTANFRMERQSPDSFLFSPYIHGDRTLQILWGIFYRLVPLPQVYELMNQERYRELSKMLDNLEAYHAECPFPHPLIPDFIAYYRKLIPNRAEAIIAWLLQKLKVDMSAAMEKRLGDKMPYGLLNFMDFVDTKMMIDLFKSANGEVNVEEEIGKILED